MNLCKGFLIGEFYRRYFFCGIKMTEKQKYVKSKAI